MIDFIVFWFLAYALLLAASVDEMRFLPSWTDLLEQSSMNEATMLAKFRTHMKNPAFMLLFVQSMVLFAAAMMVMLLPLQ